MRGRLSPAFAIKVSTACKLKQGVPSAEVSYRGIRGRISASAVTYPSPHFQFRDFGDLSSQHSASRHLYDARNLNQLNSLD